MHALPRRLHRLRSANFRGTRARYILRAVTGHAGRRRATAPRAPPVPLVLGLRRRRDSGRGAREAVDLSAIARRAEEEDAPARRDRALHLSNRGHAVERRQKTGSTSARRSMKSARRTPSRRGLGGWNLRALPFCRRRDPPHPRPRRPTTRRAQNSAVLSARRQPARAARIRRACSHRAALRPLLHRGVEVLLRLAGLAGAGVELRRRASDSA